MASKLVKIDYAINKRGKRKGSNQQNHCDHIDHKTEKKPTIQ